MLETNQQIVACHDTHSRSTTAVRSHPISAVHVRLTAAVHVYLNGVGQHSQTPLVAHHQSAPVVCDRSALPNHFSI